MKSLKDKEPTIRPVIPNDFDRWKVLWEGYNTFYKRVVPVAITEMTWSRFFEVTEPVHALVAEREGRLLGLVHYVFHRNTRMIEPVCYLHDLFTLEGVRRRGVGRLLIEGVYARAADMGSKRVYWHTHETNVTAMKLYDKVADRSGFIQYVKQT